MVVGAPRLSAPVPFGHMRFTPLRHGPQRDIGLSAIVAQRIWNVCLTMIGDVALTRIASVAQRVNINPPPGTVQGKFTSRILAVEQ
jgi:hypothetical protein